MEVAGRPEREDTGRNKRLSLPGLVEVPALQLLADPGDDAGHLVLEDAEDRLLSHARKRAVAGLSVFSM
eukprot:3931128-Alexandrium_andersonii.AAC.1